MSLNANWHIMNSVLYCCVCLILGLTLFFVANMEGMLQAVLFVQEHKNKIKWSLYGAGTILAAAKTLEFYLAHRKTQNLRAKAAKTRQKRRAGIEQVEKALQATSATKRSDIANLDYGELRGQLQDGVLTCVEVLHTYQELAIKAHERTNCITEFVMEAQTIAEELDNQRHMDLNKHLPLLGLPFSVKESIVMSGYDSTLGLARNIGDPMKSTCLVIELLQKAGAVPFVRTNVPQLLTFGCANEIYGVTTNPLNTKRASGGSSCGEAALIACQGSVFGLGTDLGGSIRLPAHFSGCQGFRPSSQRVSQAGANRAAPGRAEATATIGPMSQSVECLNDVMKTLYQSEMSKFDPLAIPILWQPYQERSLLIGYFETEDEMFAVTPACRRAVRETVDGLRAMGHRVVPWRIPSMHKVYTTFLTAAVGGELDTSTGAAINDLPCDDHMQHIRLGQTNATLRHLYLRFFDCSRRMRYYDQLPGSVKECHRIYSQINQWRRDVFDSWAASGIDVLICPPNALPAMPRFYVEQLKGAFMYSAVFNMLDCPSGVVSVSHVTAKDVSNCAESYPRNDLWDKYVHRSCGKDSEGLSLGVQVAALPHKDEICLAVMKIIQDNIADQ